MCTLFKLVSAKFGISNLSFQKLSKVILCFFVFSLGGGGFARSKFVKEVLT